MLTDHELPSLQPHGSDGAPAVARRAYEKWAVRNRNPDTQLTDWLDAEAEVAAASASAEQTAQAQERLVQLLVYQEEAERRLGAEHAVSRILATCGSLREAAPRLLQAIGECFYWEVGAVWLLDREADLLRCLDIWQTTGIAVPLYEEDTRLRAFSIGVGLPGRVWASQSVVWVGDVNTETNLPRGPIAAAERLRCAIGFPLREGNQLFGVLEFWSREVRAPDERLIEMVSTIERQISQFVERREVERQLSVQDHDRRIAKRIQQGFLPTSMPRLAGFEISGKALLPNEVGGDCFDFIPLPAGETDSIGVLIADAMGHGFAAALLMCETLAYLRGIATTTADVGCLAGLVNRCINKDDVAANFVTAMLLRLEAGSRTLQYVNAGHLSGYVLDTRGNVRALLRSRGFPLGLAPTTRYSTSEVGLDPGDLILLMTDGVVEASSRQGELYGSERVLQVVAQNRRQTSGQIISRLFAAVGEFSHGRFQDDLTAVVIKVDVERCG
jgi:serine phosphatase RsbU (regulator of sigma subunit)